MKKPDLSDLLMLLGALVALHAVAQWSPVVAQLLAGTTLALLGVVHGVSSATKRNAKPRSQ